MVSSLLCIDSITQPTGNANCQSSRLCLGRVDWNNTAYTRLSGMKRGWRNLPLSANAYTTKTISVYAISALGKTRIEKTTKCNMPKAKR